MTKAKIRRKCMVLNGYIKEKRGLIFALRNQKKNRMVTQKQEEKGK